MAQANIKAVITAEDRGSAALKQFGNNVDRLGNVARNTAKRIIQLGTAAGVAGTILGVKTAAELESARQGFITLLGSADKADKTLARIKKEAARTPFEIVGLTKATQMLAGVTKDGGRALDFILDIGEGLAAMGRGQAELDRISVNLQQIAATGRAFAIDIRQFAFAGIPIFEMLQKETGLAGLALDKFIEGGGVTFELLEKMFQSATSEGGRFFGAFKNQAGTFNQLWSNLRDTLSITAADIVTQTGLFDFLKEAMQRVGQWIIENKEPIIQSMKSIGSAIKTTMETLGSIINWIINNKPIVVGLIGTFIALKTALFLSGAAAAFSGAMAIIRGQAIATAGMSGVGRLATAIKALPLSISIGIALIGYQIVKDQINKLNQAIDGANEAIRNRDVGEFSRIHKDILKKRGPEAARRFAQSQGRATGGPVQQGETFLVGERGPELFVPKSSGKIVPNNQLQGSASPNIYNITIQAGAFMGNRLEARKFAEIVVDNVKDLARQKNISPMQMMEAR